MVNQKIAFLNISSIVPANEAIKVMDTLNKQVQHDYYPVWGTSAILEYFADPRDVPADYWWLAISDDSIDASIYGYHDLTPNGLPLGKIFARTATNNGEQWSTSASHEFLEMIEDPYINLLAIQVNKREEVILVAYEVCDACQADEHGYEIDGVLVSNFVYPCWFEDTNHRPNTKFDFKEKIHHSFEVLPGGYMGINKLDSSYGWTQQYGDKENRKYAMRPATGSRRDRRRILRSEWLCSTPLIRTKVY